MPRRRREVFKDPDSLRRRGRKALNRASLTDEIIAAEPAGEKERALHDYDVRGLFVRIRPNGAKAFYYRQPGIRQKTAVNLGSVDRMTIAEARFAATRQKNARELRRIAPFSRGGPCRWNVEQAFDDYAKGLSNSDWHQRIKRTFKTLILPTIGKIKLADLDSETALRPFTAKGSYYAQSHPHYILSAFLSWAKRRGFVGANVLRDQAGLPLRPRPTHNAYGDHELSQLRAASHDLPSPWNTVFKLMLATGTSVTSILSLRFSDLKDWPDALAGFRYSEVVRSLLLSATDNEGGPIFIARGKRTPMRFQQRHWNTLREAAFLTDARMSDVCRSVRAKRLTFPGGITKWDEFLRAGMASPADDEDVVL